MGSPRGHKTQNFRTLCAPVTRGTGGPDAGGRWGGGTAGEVLTGRSLWGKPAAAWPGGVWIIDSVGPVRQQHWRRHGPPLNLQLDNDTRFAGSSRAPRRLGRFIRFCLAQAWCPGSPRRVKRAFTCDRELQRRWGTHGLAPFLPPRFADLGAAQPPVFPRAACVSRPASRRGTRSSRPAATRPARDFPTTRRCTRALHPAWRQRPGFGRVAASTGPL